MSKSESIKSLSKKLHSKVVAYDFTYDKKLLDKALAFGEEAHKLQKRASGEPYFIHPINVALILTEYKVDMDTIITALLHDTVEDTEVTLEELKTNFGNDVMLLVDGVTKLTQMELKTDGKNAKQSENFRKLMMATAKDIRVLIIKLADRTHNMETLEYIKKPEKRRQKALETMEIYAPMAERIGLRSVKDTLQEIAFSTLYPDVAESIQTRLEFLRDKGGVKLKRILEDLEQTLKTSGVKHFKLEGREKRPVSIWNKMKVKKVDFELVSDIIAFRIITKEQADCYKILGVLHSTHHAVGDKFKDYISTPKPNGYQSLHTTIMSSEGQFIEVQIRTEYMHEIAEYGIAAHWVYKQRGEKFNGELEGHKIRWIKELIDTMQTSPHPDEFLEDTKLEMYHDQVFCYTPRGDLVALPRNATPVDFAFAVHSDVGLKCAGSKINGNMVPLRTRIKNGDQVEILTAQGATPSPVWERFVVTAKARSEVRKFIRSKKRGEYVSLGKTMLSKYFRSKNRDLDDDRLMKLVNQLGKNDIEDIYYDVGSGELGRTTILEMIYPDARSRLDKITEYTLAKLKRRTKPMDKNGQNAVSIKGLIPGMAMNFADCCHPVYGDKIVGIVTTGKGVSIHTIDCSSLESFTETPERWVDLSWESEGVGDMFNGRIKISITHEAGSLAMVANTIAKIEANINNIKIISRSNDYFELYIDVWVSNATHLEDIITALRLLDITNWVERRS